MGLLYDYQELLTIGFVKVTHDYMKKAESFYFHASSKQIKGKIK
jgi:hypothetical protein